MFRAERASPKFQALIRVKDSVKLLAWLLHPSVRSYVLTADPRLEIFVLSPELHLSGFPRIEPADCQRSRTQTLFHKEFFYELPWLILT